jgi:hypothetical protein
MTAKGQPARIIAKRTAARLGPGGYDLYLDQKLGPNELRDNEHRKAGLVLARKHDRTFPMSSARVKYRATFAMSATVIAACCNMLTTCSRQARHLIGDFAGCGGARAWRR